MNRGVRVSRSTDATSRGDREPRRPRPSPREAGRGRGRLCAFWYLRAKLSHRCGLRRRVLLSRQFDARPYGFRVDGHPGARARLGAQRLAAPARPAESHGGFVDPRAVRRRKVVSRRRRQARGSRVGRRRGYVLASTLEIPTPRSARATPTAISRTFAREYCGPSRLKLGTPVLTCVRVLRAPTAKLNSRVWRL